MMLKSKRSVGGAVEGRLRGEERASTLIACEASEGFEQCGGR